MKKIVHSSVMKLIAAALLLVVSQVLIAQDTIINVPLGVVDGKGALYDAIMNDVDDEGNRLHPNATYRLSRGQIYPVPEMHFNFDVTIDAEDGEDRPPMVIPEKSVSGTYPYALFYQVASYSLTCKNILFSGIGFDKSIIDYGLSIISGKVVIENCIFHGFDQGAIGGQNSKHYNLHVNNTIFRNNQGVERWWEGAPIMLWAALGDTLSITNSTFFNNTTVVVSNWEQHYTKYYKFSHNTVYGTGGVGQSSFAQTDSEITDNLFINIFAFGIDTAGYEHGEGALPGDQTCIVPVGENDVEKMKEEIGVESEAERKMIVHNNVYFWSQEVKDYWASRGEQFPPASLNPVFMNPETLAMFDDETAYPLFDESDNIEADPGFVDSEMEAKVIAGFLERGDILYDSAANGSSFPYVRDPFVHFYPEESGVSNIKVMVEWPLAEDLTYTNEAVLTASSTGGPVGDPRWHGPDGIDDGIVSSRIGLKVSNYPNPFSNTTTITYEVEKASDVTVAIYNAVGKEVAVLVKGMQQTGRHNVQWSPNISPGIYICRIQIGSKSGYTKIVYSSN